MIKKNDEKLYRRYTVRLFPTLEQEELMWKHIHACRFVWNYMLDLQNGRYKNGRKYLSVFNMCKDLKYMKMQPEMEWLNEISNASLQLVIRSLDDAFSFFFKKIAKYPNYKSSKKSKTSFPIRSDRSYFKTNNIFVCPTIGKVKCVLNEKTLVGKNAQKMMNIRIIYVKSSKKWILSFATECDKQTQKLTSESMGIDLGVKELAVVAVGGKKIVFHNINKSKRIRALEKKRKYFQRNIHRKYRTFNGVGTPKKGQTWKKSKNIEKYEQILREIDTKIANIRYNYIHQITRELVNMLPERVVMEDLNIQGMLKNKHLAKSVSEQNFNFFIQTMKYKCEEYGIEFIQADRFYPSSKTCSDCSHKKTDLKLKDRIYVCPVCGLTIDRDYNAAINLMNYTENKNTTDKLVTKVERKKMAQKTTIVSVA